jgi:hypothetical protein
VRVPHAGRHVHEEHGLAESERVLDGHGRPVADQEIRLEERAALLHAFHVAEVRMGTEAREEALDDARSETTRLIVRAEDHANPALEEGGDEGFAAHVERRLLAPGGSEESGRRT